MVLPSPPSPTPFASLAHVPITTNTSPAGLAVIAARGAVADLTEPGEEEGDIPNPALGGLLCPNSCAMLSAVLGWGRNWGGKEAGFAWRWSECSAIGLVPLDILAALPRWSLWEMAVSGANAWGWPKA
jgi:hypothetical protein